MLIYLTYGEHPSGVFSGQVVDVCRSLTLISGKPVKLVAFVSLRLFRSSVPNIKTQYPNSIVLPMFPGVHKWRFNIGILFFLFLLFKPKAAICRSAIATALALKMRRLRLVDKVLYDGRAAEYEQMVEYYITDKVSFVNDIRGCERKSILESDYQLSVSYALIEYWKATYGYGKDTFSVIPCTLNRSHETPIEQSICRESLEYEESDIILVYCGGVSGWQSFGLISDFIDRHFPVNIRLKMLFLTRQVDKVDELMRRYPGRIKRIWSAEERVPSYLKISDYGLLLRERSVTNRVASPVKFAEYLNAGLQIIISDGIGDYSSFVLSHSCGYVYTGQLLNLSRVLSEERSRNTNLAKTQFSKSSEEIVRKYEKVLSECK